MRALIQRSLKSSVAVKENGEYKPLSKIDKGLVVLLGVEDSDTDEDIDKICSKIEKLRIFEDENGKLNLSIKDIGGSILLISQFTLYANCQKGNRPSFIEAGEPRFANAMYEKTAKLFRDRGLEVGTGEFGADMLVSIENSGPVTIWLDSKELLGRKK